MTYLDACKKLNIEPRPRASTSVREINPFKKEIFKPREIPPVPDNWQKRGQKFLDYCHQLLENLKAVEKLLERGITLRTVKSFHLGWNPQTLFDKRELWGLPAECNQEGNQRKLWLPEGIVIPAYENHDLARIKIRRSSWFNGDSLPKYVEVYFQLYVDVE